MERMYEGVKMRIELKYGACIYCDNVSIDNIYSIDINEKDKTIELNGFNNFVEAWINYYDEVEEVSILKYNDSGDIDIGYEIPIIENGKLVYNK